MLQMKALSVFCFVSRRVCKASGGADRSDPACSEKYFEYSGAGFSK